MKSLTVAVDNMEWDSLYEDPEKRGSPHKIREGMAIEIQLSIWPDVILHHWNIRTSGKELAYLGIDPENSIPQRELVHLRANSNLFFFSGIARRVARHTWKTDRKKQTITTLVDCGFPVVVKEIVNRGTASTYVDKEGDFLVGVCLLFGSVAFSGSPFRTPVVFKVLKITTLKVVPPATMLELEPQPPQVIPETEISYHAEDVERVELAPYLADKLDQE